MTVSTSPEKTPAAEEPHELKRVMGPWLLLLFIVGDILGAGVYAVTGQMAGYVGGVLWLPFLLAFVVAVLTAFSYLELVTKYPAAAGAALYTHKAFGIHFLTFMVAFAVVCSGITSASTSANTLAQNFFAGLALNDVWSTTADGATVTSVDTGVVTLVALGFMLLLALINLRGVGESVKFNIVLTMVEMVALCIVIGVGFAVVARGDANMEDLVSFDDYQDMGWVFAVTAATSIAFFAMVGFEDSVNMVEETKEPERIFPRTMFLGLGIAALLYILVAVSVVSVLNEQQLQDIYESEGRALVEVVHIGSPDFPIDKVFPFLAVFAVANTALINMLMASRLVYGMAKQRVLPRQLSAVLPGRRTPWLAILFTTVLSLLLIWYVTSDPDSNVVANLSSTTAFLLLCVFAVVNVACLVLKRKRADHDKTFFTAPMVVPPVAAILCLYLAGPWVDRDSIVYEIAGGLMVIGVGLWVVTWLINRVANKDEEPPRFVDIDHMDIDPTDDPR
ncbi:APC family permease [Nocardioides bizhenqiangii]|uniref:APC family permease n=1 Tax=Nocardioides bizhenqiangii TaxID=3095076 RepID=A0ABZ0ZL36_9ACTN|nr:APC family permease [Nocardioides sp. HM61]WQQ25045.1 APC family permease [Nocardioides sp. HM61]